jgi:5'-nucleotidase/UDP-sugar diphosphatase
MTKVATNGLVAAADENDIAQMRGEAPSRRELLSGAAAVGATMLLPASVCAAADRKQTFTILHTNDLHSNFVGMAPSSDYNPFKLNDDSTRGGFARLAALIANRRDARKDYGPVLVLDDGDYSMAPYHGQSGLQFIGDGCALGRRPNEWCYR